MESQRLVIDSRPSGDVALPGNVWDTERILWQSAWELPRGVRELSAQCRPKVCPDPRHLPEFF